jgi:hypothetical protein
VRQMGLHGKESEREETFLHGGTTQRTLKPLCLYSRRGRCCMQVNFAIEPVAFLHMHG